MNPSEKSDLQLTSIIVITYNSSKYVLETLESTKLQTYQNIEIIISDDCSTDNTVEICRQWIEENRSRFVRAELITAKKNTGIPGNCNRGLGIAQGEWIKIIAADDILLRNCIEVMVAFSIVKESYISTSYIEEFCEDGLPVRVNKRDASGRIKFFQKKHNEQFKSYVRSPVFLNTPAILFRNDLFKKIGCFDESFKMLEDQPFLLKALRAGYNIYCNEEVTVRYRTAPKDEDRIKGQQEDYYLCFNLYRRPYLNKCNILDMLVLYDYYLGNQTRNSINVFEKYIYRVLFNLTDPIYIKKKLDREDNGPKR